MTIYDQEPVNGNFNDATNAMLKTIHSDDEDELDGSTDDEEDDGAMILLIVIDYSNFMIIIIRVILIERFAWPSLILPSLVHTISSLLKVI